MEFKNLDLNDTFLKVLAQFRDMNEKLTMAFECQDDMSHHSDVEHINCITISVIILNLGKLPVNHHK